MKKYLLALTIALAGLSLTVADAEARRLGGGGFFGKQSQGFSRPAPTQQAPTQATSASQVKPAAAPGAQPPAAASPWRNLFGGALLGLGLGALLAQFGIGGALAGIISAVLMVGLLLLAASFLYRMLRGKNRPVYAGVYPRIAPQFGPRLEPNVAPASFNSDESMALAQGAARDFAAGPAMPADFDAAAFVRHAKSYFLRLQAAWDRADIADIREFTSPEMFAELRMQLHERGASPNSTDVVSLDGELLGLEMDGGEYLVSVRFSGLIKEGADAPAEPFSEVWNLSKPVSGPGGWVLAGIQQLI